MEDNDEHRLRYNLFVRIMSVPSELTSREVKEYTDGLSRKAVEASLQKDDYWSIADWIPRRNHWMHNPEIVRDLGKIVIGSDGLGSLDSSLAPA